jgi:hypothetical protein
VGLWQHIVQDLTSGKGQFRLILQPAMAIILGVRLGIADARAGEWPFFWRMVTERRHHWALFKQSLSDAVFPLVLALVLDSVLQYLTLHRVRPLAAVFVGGLLVWIPFMASRGLSNRAWRRTHHAPLRPKHEG